ncbi:hypothetical protein HOF92_02335 [bacterium]|jgi:pantoate--beta-alanine ligase|nr:hypothetical protein [bacterium]
MTLRIFPNEEECLKDLRYRARGAEIGIVPCTMPFHLGSQQMFARARSHNDWVVALALPPEDMGLEGWGSRPADLSEQDREILIEHGVDAFLRLEKHHSDYFELTEKKLFSNLGLDADRVTEMCSRFLNLLCRYAPRRLYLYDLYYRESLVIEELVSEYFKDLEVIHCPLRRELGGLVSSSANFLLTASEIESSKGIFETLQSKFNNCIGLSCKRISRRVADALEDLEFESVRVFLCGPKNNENAETIGRHTRIFASVKIRDVVLVDTHSLEIPGERD